MGTLTLVRHGQASLGADDYDQLSALGRTQCLRLGQYWRARGRRFDAVLTGTLKRHAQSFAAIAEGLDVRAERLLWPGLNEYDSEALIRAIHDTELPSRPVNAEQVREHFRLLRQALLAWMRGDSAPEGMPSFAEFSAGVASALAYVREQHADADVLIVSSGGPISTAVGQVLNAPLEAVIEMNMRIRNSALTEFAVSPKRHALLSFNHLPHLDTPDAAALHSYA